MKLRKVKWSVKPVQVVGLPENRWYSETGFQIYAATWLRKKHSLTGLEYYDWWHHSANERSNGREGFVAKMAGQSKGFPDFVHLRLRCAIELKVPGGTCSPEQLRWIGYLQSIGWIASVVYDFDSFVEVVEKAIARFKELSP